MTDQQDQAAPTADRKNTWWREFVNALAGRAGVDDDPDHCGQPTPSVFRSPPWPGSSTWCVRRPGHGIPHRDRDGTEWIEREGR